MSIVSKFIKTSCLCAAVVGSAVAPSRVFPSNFIFNLTASMPIGIYRRTALLPTRGQIVGACVPDSFATLSLRRGYLEPGRCANGTRPVMKYVAAVGGDSVEVRLDGVLFNGEAVPNTRIIPFDPNGRPVPHQIGTWSLKPGQYWLLSNHAIGSLDSRYFGPVTTTLGVVEPYLTWNELCQTRFFDLLPQC